MSLSQFQLTWVSLGLILARFGWFWVSLASVVLFWVILGNFLGSFDLFAAVLARLGYFYSFWVGLARFVQF